MIAQDTSSLQEYLLEHQLELTPDGRWVRWRRNHPGHPRNWSRGRKLYDIILICALDLFTTATSTAGTGAATQAKHEYHLNHTLAIFCFVTIFLFSQVAGSITLPAWSETFGRKNLYILCSLLSAVCCAIIGAVHSLPVMVIMRVIAGLLSALPYTIAGGSCEDMFNTRDRVWAMYWLSIGSNLGLLTGPILSSYVIAALSWRWVFYIYAVILAVLAGLLCFIRESRPSLLLSREVSRLRSEQASLSTVKEAAAPLDIPPSLNHDHIPDLKALARDTIIRPGQLFIQEPIIFTTSIIIAIAFSLIYIFTEALPLIYTSPSLGLTHAQSSLPFLAIGIGMIFSVLTRLLDLRILAHRKHQRLPLKPETKLTGLVIGAPILALSLWWFAWTIPPLMTPTHWIVPTIPLVPLGYALTEFDTVLYAYISDSYLTYSASAYAALAFLRAGLSGAFPLFTTPMFNHLGNNVAVSVLAAVATAFCAVPPLFVCFGERIRARSAFARYSIEIQGEMGRDEDDF